MVRAEQNEKKGGGAIFPGRIQAETATQLQIQAAFPR